MATNVLTTSATSRDVPVVPGNATYVSLPPARPHTIYRVKLKANGKS